MNEETPLKESDIRPAELFNRYLELSLRDGEALLASRSSFVEVSCPGCGGGNGVKSFEKHGFSYVLCINCETLFVSPRPNVTQLASFYRSGESVKFWSTEFYRQTAESRRHRLFRPRAALVGDLLDKHRIANAGCLVDIGAGYGIFLEEIQRLRCFDSIVGIEPGPGMAAVCRERGFHVIEKPLEETNPSDIAADVLTCFEVLEHVFDPLAFLQAATRLLRPGGSLVLTTLTATGFDIQVLWEHSKSVSPPHHLNLLSIRGLLALIARCGLEIVECVTPGELDVDIVVNAASENRSLPLPRFVSTMLKTGDHETLVAFQRFLIAQRLSSHVRVLARSNAEQQSA